MTAFDLDVLAERCAAVERHLARVGARLPQASADFHPSTDASDAVVLHLWLAVQIVIDLAISVCIRLKLGAPSSYADAFDRLKRAHRSQRAIHTSLVSSSIVAKVVGCCESKLIRRASRTTAVDTLRMSACCVPVRA